jgi:SAM-dependent methyltransferase
MSHWTEEAFLESPEVFRVSLDDRVETGGDQVDQLLSLLAEEHGLDPETALDVACGVGRHAVPMAARGLDVRGLDLSTSYLEAARERAVAAGVEDRVRFEEYDMRDLTSLDHRADLVTNLWTSFGYFDDETNREVLAGLRSCVADGGALVLDLANREGTLANFDADTVEEHGPYLSAETREYDPVTARMASESVVFERTDDGYETIGELEYDVRLYAPVELRTLLDEVGFGDVHLYASLEAEDLEGTSNRMIAVARP